MGKSGVARFSHLKTPLIFSKPLEKTRGAGRWADWRADAGWDIGRAGSGGILSRQPLGPRFHATPIGII